MNPERITRIAEVIRIFTRPAIAVGILSEEELEQFLNHYSPKKEKLITFKNAADQLSVSTRTISRMLEADELQGKRLRPHHPQTMRIFQSSVEEILEK